MSPMVSSPLTTEHALLGFLYQEPTHGYEIHRRLSDPEGLGLVWNLKQNQLYALLGKLERQGYVITELELQDNRPPRKIFQLTDAGREAFLTWVRSPVQHGRKLRLDFLAKLYFARREGEEATRKLIEQQRVACRDWLAQEQTQAEHLRDSRPYDWLVHKFRMGQIQAMLTWLDTCQDALATIDTQ